MVAVMLTTVGRRPARAILLGLPIGVMLHLVFDGVWTDADLFWWPLGGWGFDGQPLPEVARGLVERARSRSIGHRRCWCGRGAAAARSPGPRPMSAVGHSRPC